MELEEISRRVRYNTLYMITKAGSGHPGGSLSAIDIMVTLYFKVMRYKVEDPFWEDRDRFVLSKGHACPALYAIFYELGIIKREELDTLRKPGSRLQGHPDIKRLPWAEFSSGSLGQGLSFGVGVALSGKIDRKDYYTFVMLGDGESQEGQVWEAAMSARKFKLDHLIGITDRNRLQIDGGTESIMPIDPIADKWRAFGWNVIEIDGHNFSEITGAIEKAKENSESPTMIIAHTIKGKGVSFMENVVDFHGKAPTAQEWEKAKVELGGDYNE
ncbi:MAG TPA: transketolase [bacterium]|jgi:transketolase|nr:transketolase [bacterium]HRR92013.1 transketolase [bacterium]